MTIEKERTALVNVLFLASAVWRTEETVAAMRADRPNGLACPWRAGNHRRRLRERRAELSRPPAAGSTGINVEDRHMRLLSVNLSLPTVAPYQGSTITRGIFWPVGQQISVS